MSTPTPYQVLEVFGELTGITFRFVPDAVLRQAAEFAKHFTFAELEAVIRWTGKQMATGKVNFNAGSVTWKKLMGDYGSSDAFQVFQERLGLAQEDWKAKRFRYAPRFNKNERIAEIPAKDAKSAKAGTKGTQDEAERDRIAKLGAEALKNFKL